MPAENWRCEGPNVNAGPPRKQPPNDANPSEMQGDQITQDKTTACTGTTRVKRNAEQHQTNGTNRSPTSAMGRSHKRDEPPARTQLKGANISNIREGNVLCEYGRHPTRRVECIRRNVTTRRSPERRTTDIRQKQETKCEYGNTRPKVKCKNTYPTKPQHFVYVGCVKQAI